MGRAVFIACRLALAVFVAAAYADVALAESSAPEDHGGGSGEGGASGAQYFELGGFNVTLFRNNVPAGVLTTKLVLQLASGEARAVVTRERVKLRDALLRELYRLTDREAHNGPKVDLDRVKHGMLKAARRALGPDVVEDVLVQALLRRGG